MSTNIKRARLHWANGDKTVRPVDITAEVVGFEAPDGTQHTFVASTVSDPEGLRVYVQEPTSD